MYNKWIHVVLFSRLSVGRVGMERRQSTEKHNTYRLLYEGWNFNSGNYLFTTDTK